MSQRITDADIAKFLSKNRIDSFEREYTNVKQRLLSSRFDPCSLMPGSISILGKAGLSKGQKIKFLEKQGHSYETALMKVMTPKIK